jgi:hypothetical protein
MTISPCPGRDFIYFKREKKRSKETRFNHRL